MDLSDINLLKRLEGDENKEYGSGKASIPENNKNSRKNSANSDINFDDFDVEDDDDLADLLYDDDDASQKKRKDSVVLSPKAAPTRLNDSPGKKTQTSKKSLEDQSDSLDEKQVGWGDSDINQSKSEAKSSVVKEEVKKERKTIQNKFATSPKKPTKSKIDLFLEEEEKYLGELGVNQLEELSPSSGFSIEKSEQSPHKPKLLPRKSVDVEFDDDNILDSLGDTIKSSPVKSKRQSFMDDLLSKDTKRTSVAKLSSIFDEKQEKDPEASEKDDVMVYGGYVPSAASPSRVTGSGRRQSAKFKDEAMLSPTFTNKRTPSNEPNVAAMPRNRPKLTNESLLHSSQTRTDSTQSATPGGKIGKPVSQLTSSPKRKSDDWLDFLKKTPETDSPKSSAPKILPQNDKSAVKNESNMQRKSSNTDWLGLSPSELQQVKKMDKSLIENKDSGSINSNINTNQPVIDTRNKEQYPWLSESSAKRTESKTVVSDVQSSVEFTARKQVTETSSAANTEQSAKVTDFNKNKEAPHTQEGLSNAGQYIVPNTGPQFATSTAVTSGSYTPSPLPPSQIVPPTDVGFMHAMLNSLNFERDQSLRSEATTKRKEEDLKLLETTLKSHMKVLEESLDSKLKSVQEMYDTDIKKLKAELNSLEREKKQLAEEFQTKIISMEHDHDKQVEKLKKLHNEAVSMMKQDHEDALARVKKLKDQEIDAISSTQLHSRSLQSLSDQLEMRASELAALQAKVEEKHQVALQEKEAVLVAKERELKALEGRLRWQMEEGDQERSRLQQLVLHLEKRLQQQTKEGEEDHWNVLQQKAKLDVHKKFLEEEKKLLQESIEQEKEKLRISQNSLLQEQKAVLMQLAQERQQLSSDRMQFESLAKRIKEEEARFNARKLKEESNVESQRRMMEQENEKMYLEKELIKQESLQVRAEKETLEREKRQLKDQMEKLNEMKQELKRRSSEVEEMAMKASSEREEGRSAIAAARKIESDHRTRMNQLTQQMQLIMEKQKQMLEDQEKLAAERREFEKAKNNTLCVNCKLSVGLPTTTLPPIMGQIQQANPVITRVRSVPGQSNVDPSLMVWYITAEKDREYLQEELSFLKSLKELGK